MTILSVSIMTVTEIWNQNINKL